MRCLLILCSLLAACATGLTPRVQTFMIGDVEITEHIDTDDAPAGCGDRTAWAGCYANIDGKHHIWRTSTASVWVVAHERAHALGMKHTGWIDVFGGGKCATVTASGGMYRAGQRLCVDAGDERIVETGYK